MAFQKYMEKFGLRKGIHKFAETFNLVYLLRTKAEAYDVGVNVYDLSFEIRSVENEPKKTENDSEW